MVRERMEWILDPATRENALTGVAAHFESGDTRDFRRKCEHLEIEHQLDMLFPGIRHAERRSRKLAFCAAGVVLLDFLNAALDFANIVEVSIEPALVTCRKLLAQRLGFTHNLVKNTAVLALPHHSVLWGAAVAEQIFERHARINGHRQRRSWACPTDRIRVNATIVVTARPRGIHVLDTELD